MGEYLPLSQSFNPIDASQFAQELQQNTLGDQNVQKGKIALKEVARLAQQHELVRNTVQQHTVTDPSTGVAATDHKAVLRDLYLKDPEAAEQYQGHVEDLTAERAQKALAAQKAQQEALASHAKLVGEALAAVDETGDQDQAKSDYAAAVQSLKAQGVPIEAADEVYSPGRVGYWKRKLVGPTESFKAETQKAVVDKKAEAAAKLAEQKAEAAAKLAELKGASAERVASIRNQGTITAARIRASGTVQAATIRSGAGGGADDGEDDDMIDLLADQYHLEGKLPALGQGQAALRKQILRRVATKYGKDAAGDIVSNAAGSKANAASLSKNQTNADAVAQAEQTAIANGQVFLDASQRLAKKRGRFAPINAAKNAYGRVTGDPDVVAMDGALKTFTSEYARVVSSSPSGAGQLSDHARKEALDTISGNYSMAQKQAALRTLQKDMRNRVVATNNQLNIIRQRARTGGSSVNAPSAATPDFRIVKGPDGKPWKQFKNGRLVRAQ